MSATATRPLRLVDSTVAALHLRTAYGCDITAAAIRKWGERGRIGRHDDGPARYDLDEVDQFARSRGLAGP